jgi:outer membrane protein assembly factor BamD
MKNKIHQIFLLLSLGLIIASCSEKKKLGSYTPEELMDMAIEDFENEDYIEAKEKLQTIELQYPSSQYADDAQYYMGMVHFQRDDHVLATYAFSRLEKFYPGSDYKAKAAYMAAESQYMLSPKHFRDQDYTRKAIKSFQDFQYIYPGEDSLYGLATKRMSELRSRLALKELSVAEQYDILNSPKSSLIYYNTVLEEYPDTEYYEPAFVGKIKSLIRLRRYDDALSLISLYQQKFTVPRFESEVSELKKEADTRKQEYESNQEDSSEG